MKTTLLIIVISLLLIGKGVYAKEAKMSLKEKAQSQRQEIKEIQKEDKEEEKSFFERAKDVIKSRIKKQLKGTLTAISGNSLTVKNNRDTYTATINDQTDLRRKFGGKAQLSELQINDSLIIIGNNTNDKTIQASYIRDISIQRRVAVFVGKVESKTDSSFMLKTEARGTQTVYISSQTLYKKKNIPITYDEISEGSTVLIRGEVWDRKNSNINAKTILLLK